MTRNGPGHHRGSPPVPAVVLGSALGPRTGPERAEQVVVEPGDRLHRDALGAGSRALTDVRATAEALTILLGDHVHHPVVALRLALRQQPEVGDLRGGEE